MAILTEADVVRLVEQRCRVQGDVAVARVLGVSRSYLINLRSGRTGIGPKLVQAMGLEPVYRTTVGALDKEGRWTQKKSH